MSGDDIVVALLAVLLVVVVAVAVGGVTGCRKQDGPRRRRGEASLRRPPERVQLFSHIFDYGGGAPIDVQFPCDSTRVTAYLWGGGGGGGPYNVDGGHFPGAAGGGGGLVWATFDSRRGHTYRLVRGAGGVGGAFTTVQVSAGDGGTTSLVDIDEDGALAVQAFGGSAGPTAGDQPADGGLGGAGTAKGCIQFVVTPGTQGAPNLNTVLITNSSAPNAGITLGGSSSGGGAGSMMQVVHPSSPGGTPGGGGAAGAESIIAPFNGSAGGPGRIALSYCAPREIRVIR